MCNIEKIYPKIEYVDKLDASFKKSSPWPNAKTAFNWLNCHYPAMHGHIDWEILIVIDGAIINLCDGKSVHMLPGDACLIGPMNHHALLYPENPENNFQAISLLATDCYIKELFNLYSSTLYEEIINTKDVLKFYLSSLFCNKLEENLIEIQTKEQFPTPYIEKNAIYCSIRLY